MQKKIPNFFAYSLTVAMIGYIGYLYFVDFRRIFFIIFLMSAFFISYFTLNKIPVRVLPTEDHYFPVFMVACVAPIFIWGMDDDVNSFGQDTTIYFFFLGAFCAFGILHKFLIKLKSPVLIFISKMARTANSIERRQNLVWPPQ